MIAMSSFDVLAFMVLESLPEQKQLMICLTEHFILLKV